MREDGLRFTVCSSWVSAQLNGLLSSLRLFPFPVRCSRILTLLKIARRARRARAGKAGAVYSTQAERKGEGFSLCLPPTPPGCTALRGQAFSAGHKERQQEQGREDSGNLGCHSRCADLSKVEFTCEDSQPLRIHCNVGG
ncbi:hypothetical protein HJG60_008058 [Phyllostomus discolor]|uniref:Uncharacterized protein n=1 Tax=Phyllostomus discolor TaxID=89673 RepID=A0A834BLA7_9CHIR|nr:hypothetical protein HJG60_008058 [Phyllostomus discolor]